jgi:hypothetical protein
VHVCREINRHETLHSVQNCGEIAGGWTHFFSARIACMKGPGSGQKVSGAMACISDRELNEHREMSALTVTCMLSFVFCVQLDNPSRLCPVRVAQVTG